jgi:hypothetical protein
MFSHLVWIGARTANIRAAACLEILIGSQVPSAALQTWAPKPITGMAHMLARLVYRILTFGYEYVRGIEFYETKYRQQRLQWVTKQAALLRVQLVPRDGYS